MRVVTVVERMLLLLVVDPLQVQVSSAAAALATPCSDHCRVALVNCPSCSPPAATSTPSHRSATRSLSHSPSSPPPKISLERQQGQEEVIAPLLVV